MASTLIRVEDEMILVLLGWENGKVFLTYL